MACLSGGANTDDDTVLLVTKFTDDLPTAATGARERSQFPVHHTQRSLAHTKELLLKSVLTIAFELTLLRKSPLPLYFLG